MVEYDIFKYIQFILFASYLIFIFLSIQIWLVWRDVDKNDLKINTFVSESFFKKNCAYVFSFSIFFMMHEFFEGITMPDAVVYFKLFDMLAVITLVLFAYEWYGMLKTCAHKSLPQELTYLARH